VCRVPFLQMWTDRQTYCVAICKRPFYQLPRVVWRHNIFICSMQRSLSLTQLSGMNPLLVSSVWTILDRRLELLPMNIEHLQCTLVTAAGHRPLRSADSRTCLVKRLRNQFGDRCFATARPTLWNSLAKQLGQPDITFGQFKRSFKKVYVWLVGPQHLVSEC